MVNIGSLPTRKDCSRPDNKCKNLVWFDRNLPVSSKDYLLAHNGLLITDIPPRIPLSKNVNISVSVIKSKLDFCMF
jgi:hypothetical protein